MNLLARRLKGEHNAKEVAVILAMHLATHHTLTVAEARKLVDASDKVIYCALTVIDRVLRVYKEGKVRHLLD